LRIVNHPTLEERHRRVRERIAAAAERRGRDPASVEILPVTKGHPAAVVGRVARAGFERIGENRVGEALEKMDVLGRMGVRWHMVGRLQRSKASRAVRLFDEVESVDSLSLARALDRALENADRDELDVLVQVNTSGEPSKAGFGADAGDEVALVCELERLRVRGVMTMAPFTDDEGVLRGTFSRARELHEQWGAEMSGFQSEVLSMGMSNDFEVAVEEGATRVRLGTVLLGERPDA
jgi:pyridoxal phosphate enzyme (YggS family)